MDGTLSLAMIVKDESEVLARCLDSVKNLVNEIIIVDTGSTDDTKEIAKRYTDKIYDFEWIDDFSAARNFSFEKCTGTWILWLDADDIIKDVDKDKIKNLDSSNYDIIICDHEYSHDEFGNSNCTNPRERIIRRSLGLKWEGEIHECIPLTSGRQLISDIDVHHYRKHGTSERNLKILERIVRGNVMEPGFVSTGVSSRNVYYLAKEYADIGRIDDAMPYFEKFVTMPGAFWEDVYNALYRLGMCHRVKGNDESFKLFMWKSIDMEDRRAEPYFQLGQFFMDKCQWDRAIQWLEMCLIVKRPRGLISSYQPEYYTWLPCLQLCVCYNAIGDVKKAHKYNEKVLNYRPKDSRAISNKKILSKSIVSDNFKKDGQGKKLNMGCGGKPEPGFINVDLFPGIGIDEVFELDDIPYKSSTISTINSEHSLEHVGFERVRKVLQEWNRVLMPGGELLLKIPDLELCCQEYLRAPFKNKWWYKATIYGIQTSQSGEPDEAQYHRSGFSKEEIQIVLSDCGFITESIHNYDGWGTPSIAIKAIKPRPSNIRVGWICQDNSVAAQSRIRVLNINRWLKSQGYKSEVINYDQTDNYDILIVGKSFDEDNFNRIKKLKESGKTVYCDLCEDIIEFPWVKEILQISDKAVCCSYALEEKVSRINSNTCVIEDAYE